MPRVPLPMFTAIDAVLVASLAATPVLRSADLAITITSPTSCDVTMALQVDGGADIDHRIEAFDGSRIEVAAIRGARQVGDIRTIGRTQSLVLRPDAGSYELHYRAAQPADREDRCPIWVPAAPTDGRSRSIRFQVDLPPATTPGTSMPAFTWTGGHGALTLGHLPAVVRVPYITAGEARGWGVDAVMDAVAIAMVAVATAIWTWRARR